MLNRMSRASLLVIVILSTLLLNIKSEIKDIEEIKAKESYKVDISITRLDKYRHLLRNVIEESEHLEANNLYDLCKGDHVDYKNYDQTVEACLQKFGLLEILKINFSKHLNMTMRYHPEQLSDLLPYKDHYEFNSWITLILATFLYKDKETSLLFEALLNNPEKLYKFLWGNNSNPYDAELYAEQFKDWLDNAEINFYTSRISEAELKEIIILSAFSVHLIAIGGLVVTVLN